MNCIKSEQLMINFMPVVFTKLGNSRDEGGKNESSRVRAKSNLTERVS